MGAALDRPHVAQRIAPLQRFMVDHVHARRRGTAVADSSTSALEDDESATLGTDNSTFASCSYCSLPLGKRYLRLRHKCDFCDKVVCAACAPSMVQTQGAAEPQRACARCVSPIDQVRCAKDRLAKVEHRLRVLADDDPTSMGSSKDSVARRAKRTALVDRSIDESVGLVEAAACMAEEAWMGAKLKVEKAVMLAGVERAHREDIESKAQTAKESVVSLSDRLREASRACESCSAPLHRLDEAASAGAARWAADMAVERDLTARRCEALLEGFAGADAGRGESVAAVPAAEEEARIARGFLFRLAKDLHHIENPTSAVPFCALPVEGQGSEELGRLCVRATQTISCAISDCLERGSRLERQSRAGSGSASVFSDDFTRSSSHISAQGEDRQCKLCGDTLSKRRHNPKHQCEYCRGIVCGRCSSQPRLCHECQETINQEPELEREQVARLRDVCKTMRSLCNSRPNYERSVEAAGVEVLIEECEAALPSLKQLKDSQDAARALSEALVKELEERANEATLSNRELGTRLARLYGLGDISARGSVSFGPSHTGSLKSGSVSGAGLGGPIGGSRSTASGGGWKIRDPAVQGSCV